MALETESQTIAEAYRLNAPHLDVRVVKTRNGKSVVELARKGFTPLAWFRAPCQRLGAA